MKKNEPADYTVLIDAKEVAGIRNPGEGKTISLTPEQAEHPLRLGHIEKAPVKKAEKDKE